MDAPLAELESILLARGLLSMEQLRIARHARQQRALPLSSVLLELGFVSEGALRAVLAEQLGQDSVDLAHASVEAAALQCVPREMARRYQLLPLSLQDDTLTLAIADPDDLLAMDQVRALLGGRYRLVWQMAAAADILSAIEQHYGLAHSLDDILHEIEPEAVHFRPPLPAANEASQPLVRLVDALLSDAVQREASDIHFEPEQGFLRVRYRLDGVLHSMRSLHKSFWPGMVVRLKVMSGMNIAETRAPQDGRFSLRLSGRDVDFRAATHPTTQGENLVLRILDRRQGIVPLAQLGLADDTLHTLYAMLSRPEGLLLVTGPTGSGKTTTLYSILNHLNHESVNIMTLEDPVEYPLALVRQTSLNESVKLDFAQGVRAILRQDPDIVLIGEIRDAETAEMAFRAALTGHQVFATLHSNSALGAIPRLLDLGVPADILASNLIGVVAQRLVRCLCPHCKRVVGAGETGVPSVLADAVLYQPVGCTHCQQQGYRGRLALMEVLSLDYALEDLIASRSTSSRLRQAVADKGVRSLAEDGLRRVREGITSLAEVRRVVDLRGLQPC